MRDNKEHARTNASAIQCIEVLISKKILSDDLQWTLSVYSLENQPVQRIAHMENSVLFHFMVFDWKRTIKKLLDDKQVPYSIIQYFNPPSLYSQSVFAGLDTLVEEADYLAAASVHSAEAAKCD